MNYSERDNGTLSSNTRHGTPLERGNSESIAFYQHGAPLERGKLDLSYSTDMPIRWIGSNARVEALTHSLSSRLTLPRNRDSEITPTVNELLVERIIPTGIMARYQVTLDIEDLNQDLLWDCYRAHYPFA